MVIRQLMLLKLTALLAMLCSSLAWANPAPNRTPIQLAQAEQRIDKSKAADIARSAHGGKVLTVEEAKSGGRTVFRVKLLLDGGRVRIVSVDGSSGKIL